MQHEDLDPDVERFARALIQAGGADPDTTVQPGQPIIFGTPQGNAVKVNQDALLPLWRLYVGAAKIGLEIAKTAVKAQMFQAADEVLSARPLGEAKPNGSGLAPEAF